MTAKWALWSLLALAGFAHAQAPARGEIWFAAGHVEVSAAGSDGLNAGWQFDRADNGDVRLVKTERRDGAQISATVLSVCDDRALAFKDMEPARGRELKEFSEPVLHLQLVLRILARAFPAGLPAAESEATIDIVEEKITLRLRKALSARKDIGAPWRARGSARRAGDDVRFELTIDYAGDAPPYPRQELKLSGLWSRASRLAALDNKLSLADWRVHRVDTIAQSVGGNMLTDLAADPVPLKFDTLGDLRAAIGRNWDPNVKAAVRTECKV